MKKQIAFRMLDAGDKLFTRKKRALLLKTIRATAKEIWGQDANKILLAEGKFLAFGCFVPPSYLTEGGPSRGYQHDRLKHPTCLRLMMSDRALNSMITSDWLGLNFS